MAASNSIFNYALLRNAFDKESAEFRQLVADRANLFEFCRIAIGLIAFNAVPSLYGNALLWWVAFD